MPDTTPMLMAYGVVMVWHGTVCLWFMVNGRGIGMMYEDD